MIKKSKDLKEYNEIFLIFIAEKSENHKYTDLKCIDF